MADAENKNQEWDAKVSTGAAMHRLDEKLLGLPTENYRDKPGEEEQKKFIADLPAFFAEAAKEGKTLANYTSEVDKRVGEEAKQAVWFDQVQFYKEVEEVLKMREEKENETPGIPVSNPDIQFDQEGKPITVPAKYTLMGMFLNWLLRKELPSEVRKFGDEKKLQETLKEIYGIYDEIDELNAEIFIMKNNLSALEQKLVKKSGTNEEARIRDTINKQQIAIRENMQKRAKILEKETNPKEILTVGLMQAVRKALKEESLKINKQFGAQIGNLFREKQALVNQTTVYNYENQEQLEKKFALQKNIEQIDIKLEALKKELIEYKSQRPIFLFERLVGIQSIPLVGRYGQSSTLDFSYEKPREGWKY